MSKSQPQRPFDFGRVFFPDKTNPIPDVVYFQPLGNHVGNVRKLVKAWKLDYFPGATIHAKKESKRRVDEVARVHDIAKPQKFKIESKTSKEGKFKEYIYSFKGHRFEAVSSDAWAQTLAIGYHNFSVDYITYDAYKLKKKLQDYADILDKDILTYARELYILEMCDQIEAELACRVIGDDNQAESRAFMDYTTAKLDDLNYLVDPYPFEDSLISLSFTYWSMKLSQEDKDKLQKCLDTNQHYKLGSLLDDITKNWWKSHQGKLENSKIKLITLQPYKSSNEPSDWDCESIYKALGGDKFLPNPMQKDVFNKFSKTNENLHIAILLKAPTGSGKFEAVLFPALAKGYRLILPLPARSLLEDQKQRTENYLKQFSKLHPNREFSLVVDTGSQMYRSVYRNGEVEAKPRTTNLRRHLYKGDIILTMLDKFLYRYFAYGDKQKSFVYPLRINQNKTIVCFDEAHSYDDIAFTNFHSLVQSLYEAGRSLILMTATMPKEHIKCFDYLELIDYIDAPEKFEKFKHLHLNKKSFEWISDIERNSDAPETFQNKFIQVILKEWRTKANRRIIAVVETVKDAAAIYQQIKNDLGGNTDTQGRFLFLYHGRISDKDRPDIYKQLQQRDSNNQPYLLITTSAIEVGCDLNAEVLISEICPPENLIQRAGRCNRKGNVPDAKVLAIGNYISEFVNTLDKFGWQNYKDKLQLMTHFDTQVISQCISRVQQVDDYRVVELFSMLHDYVYGADLTCQPTHEKGLVVTRSWTPSATLIYKDGSKEPPEITIPIDRLLKNKINEYANTHVYERYYNQETTQWKTRDLGWGFAYLKDILIEVSSNNEGAGMFDGKEEYPYNPELGFVELPGVFIKLKTPGFDEKLLYQHTDKQTAIITYTKALDTNADIA